MKTYHKIPIEHLCYFAGLLDGEGCIRIGKTKSQNSKHRYDYRAYIQIGMTDENPLIWVTKNIGGSYSEGKAKTVKSKICYNWVMNPIEAADILTQILPYLIVKKKQAKLFIKYATVTCSGKPPGIKGLPKKIVALRAKMWCQMKILNKKGV